jgi:hypothetical protein
MKKSFKILLRESIHKALTHLEKDGKIYDKNEIHLIAAYKILYSAFNNTIEHCNSTFDEYLDDNINKRQRKRSIMISMEKQNRNEK